MNRKKPEYICHSCGIKFCNGPVNRYATFSLGKCECCGAKNVPCTQPRDYGYFTTWLLPEDVDPLPAPKSLDDLIEPVLDDFDFEKVHKCMEALNWQWFNSTNTFDVPSIERMRAVSRGLLSKVINSTHSKCAAAGGFQAERILDDIHCNNGLILRFIVEGSESYFGDFYDD